MANIQHLLDKIRTAIYGKEVRGSLADGLEAINKETEDATEVAVNVEQRQDAVEQQFDDVLNEWTDDKPISNEETIAARTNRETGENHQTLGQRLDAENKKVNAQLADTETILEDVNSNVLTELFIDSFDNQYENIHPSVRYFKEGWNGYKYWMAYTPFPKNKNPYSARYECPSIAVSNDLVEWLTPPGLTNPVVDLTSEQISNRDYFSDPSLVMNGNVMELWYRLTNGANTNITDIYRVTSTNGITWTVPEKVVDSQRSDDGLGLNHTFRSHQVFYQNGVYRAYYQGHPSGRGLAYAESTNPSTGNWTNVTICNFVNPPSGFLNWHQGITFEDGFYEMISLDLASQRLVYFQSSDGVNFEFKKVILTTNNRIKGMYMSYPFKSDRWNVMTTIETIAPTPTNQTAVKFGLALMQGKTLESLTFTKNNFFTRNVYSLGDIVLANNKDMSLSRVKKFLTHMTPDRTKKYGFGTDMSNYSPFYQKGEQFLPLSVLRKTPDINSVPDAEGEISATNDLMLYVSRLVSGKLTWQQLTTDGVNKKHVINSNRKNVTASSSIDVSGTYRVVINSGNATNINAFTGGVDGQEIFVLNVTSKNMTIVNNSGLTGMIRFDASKANIILKPYDSITLICINTTWYIK